MKRTGFARKGPPPRPAKTLETYTPRPRAAAVAVADTRARMVVPVPKREYLRDEFYRRWVSSLPCIRCGLEGHTQAAHGPTLGKGIKADDRTCVPLCADAPGRRGCHSLIDLYAVARREERAELFAGWAEQTRALWAQKGKDEQAKRS